MLGWELIGLLWSFGVLLMMIDVLTALVQSGLFGNWRLLQESNLDMDKTTIYLYLRFLMSNYLFHKYLLLSLSVPQYRITD